jgi:hypothetical protein
MKVLTCEMDFPTALNHFAASANAIPSRIPFMDYISRYREELRRQQSALRTAWLWYLAPWVPGLGVFTIDMGRLFDRARANRTPLWLIALVMVVMLGVFAVAWLLNLRGAPRLQSNRLMNWTVCC